MHLLRDLSIKFKLTAIIMLISGIVLFSSFAAFITTDLVLLRRAMIKNVSTRADLMGTHCTAALIFNDQDDAKDILEALSTDPNITQAFLYTNNPSLFASYYKDKGDSSNTVLGPREISNIMISGPSRQGYFFKEGHLNLFKEIVLDKETIGTLYIRSTLEEFYSRMRLYTGIGAIILLASIFLAYLLSARLQHVISEPILKLADTMNLVSDKKAYSLRAEKKSNDELGVLIDGFNEMLSLIQIRDEELEKHSNHLEKIVDVRTSELSKINRELEKTVSELKSARKAAEQAQKMEAIGTLAGGVAHDLNNILAGLVGYPQILLMKIAEDSPLKKPIMTMQKSGEKAAAVVQDLLTLARRGVSVSEVINLSDIVNEYLKSPEYDALETYHSNVHLEANLDPHLLNIVGSPVHLSKTLMNLISNAAESMPDGGNVILTLDNRYLHKPIQGYDTVKEGDYVALAVSDTGIGISPDDRERIFEPFYTKKVMGRSGTGLGMAVVLGTIQDHQGYIEVLSKMDEGTSFILYFPATRQDLSIDNSDGSIEEYMGRGESILVVDDVEEQRITASAMLKGLGYEVSTVSSGEKAIEFVKNHHVDLLLLDMIMDPGIDGLETFKRIATVYPAQKAIIASGFTETERVKEALKIGVGSYVKKPYLLQAIGVAVKKELLKKT